VFLYTREERRPPNRYSTLVELLVPVRSTGKNATPSSKPEGMPEILLRSPLREARLASTMNAAITASGLESGDGIRFNQSIPGGKDDPKDVVSLEVVARDPNVSSAVALNYADAFKTARRQISADAVTQDQRGRISQLDRLRARLEDVKAQLRELFPNQPIPQIPSSPTDPATLAAGQPPVVGEDLPLETTLLIFEQAQLRKSILESQFAYAEQAVNGSIPKDFADVLEQHAPTTIVGKAPSSVTPAGVILLLGALLGLAGAVLVDRLDRSIRTEKSAAAAFAAPVLCAIPPRRRGQGEYATFGDLGTPRREAYRALAATAVATDRLPSAIMVSTPQGDAHEDVAANFASALAGLGLRVALVATSPEQHWFGEPFNPPSRGAATLPELLTMAHAGQLNGQVRQFLPRTDLNPNLVLVPPAVDHGESLPLDGLPPLLDALASAGIDITVIAGPAVLEDADAIIIAWATRSVLWAVQAGELTEDEARAATARLELAGVSSFGVAMLDPETS
jgi:hypothetical protein